MTPSTEAEALAAALDASGLSYEQPLDQDAGRLLDALHEAGYRVAAQEAPAPEGLARALWAASRDPVAEYGEMKHAYRRAGRITAALAATPPAPAEPPRPVSLVEDEDGAPYPDDVQAQFAAIHAKAWWEDAHGEVVLLSDATDAMQLALEAVVAFMGAEARPPEGLDADRLARALETLAVGCSDLSAPGTHDDCCHFEDAPAVAAEYARLSAGGATKP